MSRNALKLFLSYAHEDTDMVEELHKHLAPLRHEGIISDWYDRDLRAGDEWDPQITDEVLAKLTGLFVDRSTPAVETQVVYTLDLGSGLARGR